MKNFFLSLVLVLSSFNLVFALSGDVIPVVINEVDSDNAGGDTMEFIELYGPSNYPLDGLSIVFFNGSDDASYGSFDLDGISLNADGFAVIGNAAVPNVDVVFTNGLLQNGPDAVALIVGDASSYPDDTPIDLSVIVDAVVYITDDVEDDGLLTLLLEGQVSTDESLGGNSSGFSNARIPDGGLPQITETYVQQLPTPGYTNVLLCDGGEVSMLENEEPSISVCVNEDFAPVTFEFESSVIDASYWLVITDENGIIEFHSESLEIDFSGLDIGSCFVHGMSFSGDIDLTTLEQGDLLAEISSSECISVSGNSVEVIKTDCAAPTCDAGTVSVLGEGTSLAICINGDDTVASFDHNADDEGVTLFFVFTDLNDIIVEVLDGIEFDFSNSDPGPCRLYGVSVAGEIDEDSMDAGESVFGITASICSGVSENFVDIQKIECSTTGGCSDLYFSEYLEGDSQNKALEIYNPTPFDIDLGPYAVSTYNNGAITPTNTVDMAGTLAPGDVYIIAHSDAAPAILEQADNTAAVSWFNGNDAIVLYNGGDAIDAIGVIGEDPGISWEVNGVEDALLEHTLVRNILVNQGTTDWSQGSLQWDIYGANDFSFLGSHVNAPCDFSTNAIVAFTSESMFVNEGNVANLNVGISLALTDIEVEVSYIGGTATEGEDFVNDFPQTIDFPEGQTNPMSVPLTTIDDLDLEGAETMIFLLTAISDSVEVLTDSMIVTILPSDQEIPLYTIGQMNNELETGVADSLGVYSELRGIVHGLNLYPEGLLFTLIDGQEGIAVFSGDNDFGYTVTEGDSLHVVGVIDQFNGLTQIDIDELTVHGSGIPLMDPVLSSELNESTESTMVELKCIELADPTQWTNVTPGFTVDVTDGVNTWALRIDEDVDVFGTEAPEGVFSVIGIGGQFDSSEPYDDGYQILPRYLDDLSESVWANFEAPDVWNILDGEISFVNNSEGGDTYTWNFGDGESSDEFEPSHEYTEEGTVEVTLTVEAIDGICSDTFTWEIDLMIVSVEEFEVLDFNVYPNPVESVLTFESMNLLGDHIALTLVDISGRVVYAHEIISHNGLDQIDLATLAPGVYILSIENFNSGQKASSRIVKK